MTERRLAKYLQKHGATLHREIQIRLKGLDDPAKCALFARSNLQQLQDYNCSPPADLVRVLKVIEQVPTERVLLKEKFKLVQEDATRHRKTTRQTVRWRNAGIRLKLRLPLHFTQRKMGHEQQCRCHRYNIALCIARTKKSAITCMAMHMLLNPTEDLS